MNLFSVKYVLKNVRMRSSLITPSHIPQKYKFNLQDEPLWATAKKHNVSFSAYLWGRCDIPFDAEKRLRNQTSSTVY
jgi:hypothetical protein